MGAVIGRSVGERGQITIEKAIRERLGVRPGDRAVQHVVDDQLVVTFLPAAKPHIRSLAGVLGTAPRRPAAGATWEEVVGEAATAELAGRRPEAAKPKKGKKSRR